MVRYMMVFRCGNVSVNVHSSLMGNNQDSTFMDKCRKAYEFISMNGSEKIVRCTVVDYIGNTSEASDVNSFDVDCWEPHPFIIPDVFDPDINDHLSAEEMEPFPSHFPFAPAGYPPFGFE